MSRDLLLPEIMKQIELAIENHRPDLFAEALDTTYQGVSGIEIRDIPVSGPIPGSWVFAKESVAKEETLYVLDRTAAQAILDSALKNRGWTFISLILKRTDLITPPETQTEKDIFLAANKILPPPPPISRHSPRFLDKYTDRRKQCATQSQPDDQLMQRFEKK